MAKDVTFTHPDYDAALPDWALVTDAAAGERAVKAKSTEYLPRPNCKDTSKENSERYEQYVKRAVYYNATGRTRDGLSGIAFRRWPEKKVPAAMEEWTKDVTGTGITLEQHAKATLEGLLEQGRAGVLVDYPTTNGSVSVADQTFGGVQPTFSFYPATAITNWDITRRGSKVLLSLVVLKETHSKRDGFEISRETQYRVLRLDESGYSVEIWRQIENAQKQKEWQLVEHYMPLQGNGQRWAEIPFQFFGSANNDTAIDPAPLKDIATLNIGHYRNSADYEESVYFCGQPQVYMAGLDQEWVKMLQDNGIFFGSRQILPLPVGGSAGILQAEPNSLAKEAMDQKETQMAALGARLLTRGSANRTRTATETNSDDATAHSVLSVCCDNTSSGYVTLLRWGANFQRAEGESEFDIPTEFMASVVDAQMLTAMVQAVQAGTLPLSEFWANLRDAGLIDSEKSDEDLKEEIDAQQPATGGVLDEDDEPAGNKAA